MKHYSQFIELFYLRAKRTKNETRKKIVMKFKKTQLLLLNSLFLIVTCKLNRNIKILKIEFPHDCRETQKTKTLRTFWKSDMAGIIRHKYAVQR